MWVILEHRQLTKQLPKTPIEILKRYEKWKDIVRISGPQALKNMKGLHDESLKGNWKGFRSSRLNNQYRVIYKIQKESILVNVIKLTAHDYRRK